MVYSKNQYYFLFILILIILLITLSFLHQLQFRRKLFSQQRISIEIALPINSPSCEVITRYFYLTVDSCGSINAEQRLVVIGRVERDSDEEIFKQKRLIVEDITVLNPELASLKDWSGLLQHFLLVTRAKIYQHIQMHLPPYQAGLVLAVVFGTTEWLAEDIEPYFKITGTLHILAASGQNISLLLLLIEPLLPHSVTTKVKGSLLVLLSLCYLALVGVQPSLVRATSMSIFMILSRYFFFSQYSALYSLLTSTLLILVVRPEWLFAMGLLLSVCATLGIILIFPKLREVISGMAKLLQLPIHSKIKILPSTISSYIIDSLAVGVAAQVATFPLLFTQVGAVQVAAFVPTTIVSWLLPLLMTYTFLMLVISFISEVVPVVNIGITLVPSFLVWLPSDLFLHLLQYLAGYQWGELNNPWLE